MRAFTCLALLAVSQLAMAQPGAGAEVFTASEQRTILSHGPWPPAPRRDPGNRVSGKSEAIELGERLFYEPRLSGTGSVLCATCHVPYRGWQDGRATSFGLEPGDRNTPTLLNVAFQRRFGWDGARDSLWSQSIRPLLDTREMRSSAKEIGAFIRNDFLSGYERAFGRPPPDDDGELLADVGRALAAFQETLVSGRTPFDDFRDALENQKANAYPENAKRGLRIFVGKGGCSACHSGPLFTSGERVEFRVPGLRNVALTAPYLHDGRLSALSDAARHALKKDFLTEAELGDLVIFLQTLSEIRTFGLPDCPTHCPDYRR
ncbi:MAG TPA: cytochrome c peroxidase [Burkholderiales bacterium]